MSKYLLILMKCFSCIIVFPELFIGPPAFAGGVQQKRICLSFRRSGRFLGISSLVFCKFGYGARNTYDVVRDIAEFFLKQKFLRQKLGEWAKNGSKIYEFFAF